jgi:MoaA/NifB/PqqE/SkfB family radical SAM enzyme
MLENLKLERAVIEVFGGCNYTCKMCPQGTEIGREKHFLRKMPLSMFENILDQITPKYGHPVINLEGSGEPTQAKDLAKYVEACTRRGLKSFIYCNGSNFNGTFMENVIDAGLSLIRFSVIGYNRELYKKWMNVDNWDLLVNNATETLAYKNKTGSKCSIESYHLILDPTQIEYEIKQYQNNFVNPVGTKAYIWKMHNWSGNKPANYSRTGEKRSCGRPAAPELTVRAGGINGQTGAVTPCCQVLGPPTESASVLGHMSNQTFEEIWTGDLYNHLRECHDKNEYEEIPFCKDCDFLIDDPEVLAWTNDPYLKIGQPIGTNLEMNS